MRRDLRWVVICAMHGEARMNDEQFEFTTQGSNTQGSKGQGI